MITPHRLKTARTPERGVALVLVLAMILLLTIIVLAFFSKTQLERKLSDSSAQAMRTDALARSALDTIIGDLRQEIVASSIATNTSGSLIYTPKTVSGAAIGMLPWKSGVPTAGNTLIPNLIRRSVSPATAGISPYVPYSPDYTTPPEDRTAVASGTPANVSSATPSLDGKFISLARWNSHYLIPRKDTSNVIDPTPVDSFVAPDWIIVTRSGAKKVKESQITDLSNATLSKSDFAIGRYAYAIYEVGGLLDVNVAGYPTSMTAAQSGRKGPTAFADLTSLDNIITQADIDKLVGWRNNATAQPGGNIIGGYTFGPLAADRYYKSVLANMTGFLSINPPANPAALGINSQTDQRFTSRQALLKFRAATGLSQNALQYLTTFSRDLNAPSWSPTNPVALSSQSPVPTLMINYEIDADKERLDALLSKPAVIDLSPTGGLDGKYTSPIPNRNLLKAVWSQDRTIKDWDGNDVKVKTGEPIVKRRFPLNRIDLFRQYQAANAAEKPALALKIKFSFGLVPDPGLPSGWIYNPYVYVSGATNLYRLLTVDEMDSAAPTGAQNFERRELNFFELLRAGILRGEIGNWNSSDDDKDAAIMTVRIGANIIDQYDADNYPTMIFLQPPASPVPGRPYPIQIAGIENIPYMSEVIPRAYRKPAGAENDPERRKVSVWMEFELWNPHSNAGQVAGLDSPTNFRIVAVTGKGTLSPDPDNLTKQPPGSLGQAAIDALAANPTFFNTTSVDYGAAYAAINNDANPNQIKFQYPATSTFVDPTMLGSGDASAGVVYPNPKSTYTEGAETIAGLFIGETDTSVTGEKGWPEWTMTPSMALGPPSNDYRAKWLGVIWIPDSSSLTPKVALEFQDARNGNRWVPYQSFDNRRYMGFDGKFPVAKYYPNAGLQVANLPMTFVNGYAGGYTRIDPRGARFNTLAAAEGGGNLTAATTATPGFSTRPDVTRGFGAYQTIQGGGSGEYPPNSYSGGPIQVGNRSSSPSNDYPSDLIENSQVMGPYTAVIRGRDQILRPADGDRARSVYPTIPTAIGSRKYLQNVMNAPGNAAAATLVGADRLNDRPLMLNRPFQSVGEMGYAFRDMPWKTLNFSSSVSAESGLLDLFCINESPFDAPLSAGRVNLNSASAGVLKAILVGATRKDDATVPITPAEADVIVADFIAARTASPLRHRSELVNVFYKYLEKNNKITGAKVNPYHAIKTRQEAIARAFGEAGQTRTWNLLIDIVAQSGRYPVSAANLAKFAVQGEKRYWLHIAIDRFTGKVLDQQLEPVYE
jgi:hypothetical protein